LLTLNRNQVQNQFIHKRSFITFFCFTFCTIVISCKKEYKKLPYYDIESFIVTGEADKEYKAAIVGEEIIVYMPPFVLLPDSIAPKITVSEGATVTPASGVKVPFTNGQMYTVTAQDGSVKKYTLKPLDSQPEPVINSFSEYVPINEGTLYITGQYLVIENDTARTKLVIIRNSDNHIFPVEMKEKNGNPNIFSIVASLPSYDPESISLIDTGSYHFQVTVGTKTKKSGTFNIGRPDVNYITQDYSFQDAGKEVKAGATFKLNYTLGGPAVNYYKGKYTYAKGNIFTPPNTYTDVLLNLVSQTDTELEFRLPEGQTGYLTMVELYNSDGKPGSSDYMYGYFAAESDWINIIP
jgi:hypothetical protein